MKRKMLYTLITMILILGTLGMTACSPKEVDDTSQDAVSADLLSQIQEKGEIIIATEGTWSPWTYHDENDTLIGFDVEVAQKVAEKLGVNATFVETKWDGIFAGLDSKRYDIAANGVEITDERGEKYDFSDPYAFIRTVIIVNESNEDIGSFEDLSGKKTANTLGSTYGNLAQSYGAEPVAVDDLNQTMEMLLANRVDVTLNAEVSYYDYMKAHPDASIKIVAQTQDAAHVSFPIRKGEENQSLIVAINQAILELQESGEIAEISTKYFGTDISQG